MKTKKSVFVVVLGLAAALVASPLAAQVKTVVATDEIESDDDYSAEGPTTIAQNVDESGSWGLEAQAGDQYVRYSAGNSQERIFTVTFDPGFISGHTVRAGTYTATVNAGTGVLGDPNRDGFTEFEFRLITVDGEEIGERTVVQEYVLPAPGEWTTVEVSYVVEDGSPLIGQTLTWSADCRFEETEESAKFGAIDNIIVSLEESGEWMDDFTPVDAPFALDFGEGAGQDTEEDLLRSRSGDFVLQADSLRYAPGLENFVSTAALASVQNYLNRQDFTLEADVGLNQLDNFAANRVGFSVLGGPHDPPDSPFNAVDDNDFYGLMWLPAPSIGESTIQIREGFNGEVLVEAPWEGVVPFGDFATLLFDDFEDVSTSEGDWTVGGSPADFWEFGEPGVGPDEAVSGSNVAGTDLDGFYGENTEAWLRTPVLDLTGFDFATLSFYEFTDLDDTVSDQGTMFHFVRVAVLDPDNPDPDNPIDVLEVYNDVSDWRFREFELPPEALDREIVIEFRIESDSVIDDDFAGWYLDDVEVSAAQPMSPSDYHLQADGVYDPTGLLELTFTLTDEDSFSQSVSTQVLDPFQGDLFGIGGRSRGVENPIYDFDNFSMAVGDEPGPLVDDPVIEAPFEFLFGSADGRDSDEDFRQNQPDDWSLVEEALRLTTDAADFHNSLASTRVFNFDGEQDFLLATEITLDNLDTASASDNRVGLVLFGDDDREVFDPDDDTTFYSLQWIPNGDAGGSLVFREGMNGAEVARTDFADLDNPPMDASAGVGTTYSLEFFGFFNESGALEFTGVLTDEEQGVALVSGNLDTGLGNRFGFGASHRGQENPSWDFHSLTWQNDPIFEEPDPSVVARDEIGALSDYTVESDSGIATEVRSSGSFGLDVRAGTDYFSHTAGDGIRDASTTLTNGFDSGHTLQEGSYEATIDLGRGVIDPPRAGYSTVEFRLVTLDGEEIGEPTVVDAYVAPEPGEWTRMRVTYTIEEENPLIGEPITWNAQITHDDGDIGLFGAMDNIVVRFEPPVTNIVARDDILSTGDYTLEGDGVAAVRDGDGAHGLPTIRDSTHYLRYGGSFTEARSFSVILTDGFVSGHVIEAGTYEATVDIGRNGEDLGRDSYETFEFRLMTLDGTEIGERTVKQPYAGQPDFGEWTTIEISYTIEPGDPVIGETLTWGAEAGFSSSDVGKFGPIDNILVNLETVVEETTFEDWQTQHFGDETDPDIIGPEATPANDGVANLIKYAFGFDPLTSVSGADLPQPEADGGVLRLTYPERRNASDVIYTPERSLDLNAVWDENVTEVNRVQDGDFDMVTVEADVPDGTTTAFLRVNVQEN